MAELLAPDELPDLIAEPDFTALPFAERQSLLEQGIAESSKWVAENEGWTPETWKGYGQAVQSLRDEVTQGETVGEKAAWLGSTALGVLKDSAITAGTAVADLVLPPIRPTQDPEGNFSAELRGPGTTVGESVMRGGQKLLDTAQTVTARATSDKDNQLTQELSTLRQDIDEGNLPFDDPAKLGDWLSQRSTAIESKQADWWKTAENWSDDDDDTVTAYAAANNLTNPKNTALLATYMRTRDPKVWDALTAEMTQGPEAAALQNDEDKLARTSALGQYLTTAFGPEGSNYLTEAGDPFEVAGNLLPLLKGAKIVRKGMTLSQRLAEVSKGAVGEVLSEQGSLTVDNPFATWQQREQIAKDTLAGVLGLTGAGAAIGTLTNRIAPTDTPADVLGTPPQPGAAPPPTAPQPITPLIDLARRAGSQDRVRLTPEEAAAGLTDPGTLEGDLLTDTRFRPPLQPLSKGELDSGLTDIGTGEGDLLAQMPPQAILPDAAPAGLPESNGMAVPTADASGTSAEVDFAQGTNLARATPEQLAPFGIDQDVAVAQARLAAARDGNEQGFAKIDLMTAQRGLGPQARRVNQVRRQIVNQAIANREPVAADAMDIYARTPINALDAAGNIQMQGMPAGYVQRGQQFVFEQTSDPTVKESLTVVPPPSLEDLNAQLALAATESNGFTNTDVVGNRPDGSTILFAELVDLASRALQTGTRYATWAANLVKQFGQAIKQYLAGAWQAARKTSRQGFLHPGDLPNVITTRLGLQRNAPFRVKQLGARDLLLGSTLPAEMVPLVAKSQNEVKALEQAAAQLARDLQAAETAAVNKRNLPLDVLHGKVTDFLNGVPTAGAVLSAMDPVTYDRARRMRNFIDDLTATVAASLPAGTMRDTLVNNTGSWLRRSYAAFDPNSGWNYDNLLRAAKRGQDIGGRPALDVLRKGAAYLSAQNNYPASMRTAQGLPAAGSELEADMRNLMDRDQFERSLTGQPGASKNVTSLMRRKDIPQQIRELMGEETNVYKRFVASASFQAQFIRRHHAQLAMRKVGLASGLLSPTRQGVFTQEIPGDGPEWSGLAGLWTTPELWQALQNSHGVAAAGKDIAGYVGRFLRFTSSKAKLNRVALNPDSWMVNGLGGATMMLMNGDWFSGRVAARLMEAVRLMKSGAAKSGDVVNAAQDTLKDIQRDLIARLTAEGIFGAGITVADIEASLPRHTLQWIETDLMRDRLYGAGEGLLIGQGIGRGFGTTPRVVGGVAGAVLGGLAGTKRIRTVQNAIADMALTKPDMLFRLTGFLTNYEAALGAGLAPDAAFNEATNRTLNTFPNYAAVPAFLRSLSQFGAINSFVSFMFEMYRNTGWSMRYLAQDLAAPSMAQKRRGLQRLAGAGAVAGLMAGGLPALLALAFGKDDDEPLATDDERNAIFTRWFAAPWERDAILAFSKFDKEGVSYLNTSYLLPQQILGELAMAARNGDNPADAAARIVIRLQTQFAGDSVNLAPLMQAYTNTDGRGRPVTVRDGIEGTWERADHALKVIAEPGFVDKVNRLAYAHREAARRGRTFSVEQEFRRLIGLREMTRTWDDLTLGRYREFDKQIGRIREGANRTLSENLPGAKATAIERANRELTEIRADLQRFEKEAAKLGVPPGVMFRAKKETGLSLVRNVMVDPIKGNRVKSIGTR
jgi:hypothetical protein